MAEGIKQPEHLAIIMDGNGRWATARNRPRTYGHIQGARAAKKIITAAVEAKIKYLTLFAFSTENWFRSAGEVSFLMRLLGHQLLRERATLMKNNIRFQVIGEIERLPAEVRKITEETVALTRGNTGMTLIFALSYGGRQDIASAARAIAIKIRSGELDPEAVDEALFSSHLETRLWPDPDLIIRTSGESRISNFYLWQSAYSEIHFVEKAWPEFKPEDLHAALASFARCERRFGRVPARENLSVI